MSEAELKPDYFRDKNNTTSKVLLIPFHVIEECVLKSYEHVGNPAASKQQLLNVFTRLIKAFLRYELN